jgi:predicted metalloprotease with PDZ domain
MMTKVVLATPLGFTFVRTEDGNFVVTSVQKDGNASKAADGKIEPGMDIVTVNGNPVDGTYSTPSHLPPHSSSPAAGYKPMLK